MRAVFEAQLYPTASFELERPELADGLKTAILRGTLGLRGIKKPVRVSGMLGVGGSGRYFTGSFKTSLAAAR